MLARTAENLYWLSRQIERADFAARIIDATLRLSGLPKAYGGSSGEWEGALQALGATSAFKARFEDVERSSVLEFLTFDMENPASIRNCIAAARTNARAVRAALTTEMWQSINSAWLELTRLEDQRRAGKGDPGEELTYFLDFVKTLARDFDGAAYRTMLRNEAYWFNRIGLYIERADNTARILDVKYHVLLPQSEQVGGSLDYFQWTSILRSVSALTAYHWVYRESIKPWLVADLLVKRPEMPRSLYSCYENLTRFLDELAREYGRQGQAQRHARSVAGAIGNARMDEIFQDGLHEYIGSFLDQNNRLGNILTEQYLAV
ncbi:MAG: alpha-E domain-containing protein [Beijerinckiaceae bacterium]